MQAQRRLQDLISVGPAMLRDFEMLGIRSVKELAKQGAERRCMGSWSVDGAAPDIWC